MAGSDTQSIRNDRKATRLKLKRTTTLSFQNQSPTSPIALQINYLYQQNTKEQLEKQLIKDNIVRIPKIQKLDREIAEQVVDFLNLVFQIDTFDTIFFWDIIQKQVRYDYNYQGEIDPSQVMLGGLLNSVIYHCDFQLDINYPEFSEIMTLLQASYQEVKSKLTLYKDIQSMIDQQQKLMQINLMSNQTEE